MTSKMPPALEAASRPGKRTAVIALLLGLGIAAIYFRVQIQAALGMA